MPLFLDIFKNYTRQLDICGLSKEQELVLTEEGLKELTEWLNKKDVKERQLRFQTRNWEGAKHHATNQSKALQAEMPFIMIDGFKFIIKTNQ